MGTAIKVENLSKAYQLGEIGTGTLSRDLERYWAKLRGNEDPFLRIGESNDRTVKGESDVVWSLKDLNFEIEQGDAVGIIGRNGAGKSTLLKILSRVTSPTIGNIKVKGRVASLLEVGTGFHPELTGRENIFLNGAILGMRKAEIKKHFDAIVDFAGIERYIDTPVKRYSSGMYVRLAFAVAAHLESEILVVDEVLAVGDAEFQKKCLGKMNDVSKGEGRTVLFVSHNMSAVSNLCEKGILLENGHVKVNSNILEVTQKYFFQGLNKNEKQNLFSYRNSDIQNSPIVIKDISIKNHEDNIPVLDMFDLITLLVTIQVKSPIENASIGIGISNSQGINTDLVFSWDDNFYLTANTVGEYLIEINLNNLNLTPNSYTIGIGINQSFNTVAWDTILHYPLFEIENKLAIKNWDFRPWAVHHVKNCIWKINKI